MNDGGRLCHSLVLRVDRGADPDRLGENLARVAGAGTRLWVEDLDVDAGSLPAARWRDRELRRPLDPHLGPPLRAVLGRYDDGLADLVLVAHRGAVGSLQALARAVLLGCDLSPARAAPVPEALVTAPRPVEGPSVDWGLGDPSAGSALGQHQFSFDVPEDATGEAPEAGLLAALGLVLSRCTGQELVAVGRPDLLDAVTLKPASTRTVGAYLRSVEDALAGPGGAEHEPIVGLVTSRGTEPIVADGVRAAGLEYRPFLGPVHPLSIHVCREHGRFSGTCTYERRSFGKQIVEQLCGYLATACRTLAEVAPETPLAAVDPFDEVERRRIVELGGAGVSLPVPPACIHQVVAARAAESPDAVAVCYERERLTYRELDERANRAAHALRALGVGPEARVGVCLERSLDLVVLLLGVLKSGAAYVPMDPAYPADRLSFTVQDAELDAVVAGPEFPAPAGLPVLDPPSLLQAPFPVTPPGDRATPDAPAYVIYTSGSTGRPKGVVVPHRNVVGLLAATQGPFALGRADTWTMFHSPAFDFSVWEIWCCLMSGARLVVVPYWVSRAPEDFAALLTAEGVTVLSQTPSAFSQLMEVDRRSPLPDPPRLVVFGGEPLDAAPLLQWFDRHPEQECRLVNMFGITETTVHVTAQTVTRREALTSSRSVGPALPGWHLYVMDPHGRLVPPGVAGEIYVGGCGVASGYLNRPELTTERFVADPFSTGRIYRSGDRGRLLPDGRLEHLGRLDSQVKLRGHRIELNEIRVRLLEAPAVAAAAVVLTDAVSGDRASARLDAYVVFHGGEGDVGQVRRHLLQFLPEYMVPSTISPLVALPLTSNGKVDVARLPDPVRSPAAVEAEPDDGTVEGAVRAVWESVFGVRVGPDDSFFTLGGNSLLAVRLSAALRARGLPAITVKELYLHPSVAQLTGLLAGRVPEERKSA